MGDQTKKTLQAKPKVELEELYQGIPDESVNLTFQDLAKVNAPDKRNSTMTTIEHISEASITSNPTKSPSPLLSPCLSPLAKLPSLDFSKGLQATNHSHLHHDNKHNHHQDFGHGGAGGGGSPWGHSGHRVEGDRGRDRFSHASDGARGPRSKASEYSMSYDGVSGVSLASGKNGGGRRRRPGIPHTKICTICSNYVYIFRTRCMVCGRVYCRQCVETGMGEMIEGRKCVECLGLRFSQRYIERAGMVGCCSWRYPSTLKRAELMWAEKGPRRSGDRGYGHHGMASSRPRTPASPRSPLSIASNEPSFVMSATYSSISPHHHLPI